MLTSEQSRAYLERINYIGEASVSKEALDELIMLHQCAVPFETCEIHLEGTVPSLLIEDLYSKIVINRRGGYCFELNKLFEALLTTLGFDARPCLCRAVRGREGRMPINHRGILVQLHNRLHFVDVGFGGPMAAGSLLLADGEEQSVKGELFIPRVIDRTWWAIDRITRSEKDYFDDGIPERRQTELELCLAMVEDIDFDALNVALSQPGSLFRDHLIGNLRASKGHRALMDDVLTVRNDGEKKKVFLANKDEISRALADYFNISRS